MIRPLNISSCCFCYPSTCSGLRYFVEIFDLSQFCLLSLFVFMLANALVDDGREQRYALESFCVVTFNPRFVVVSAPFRRIAYQESSQTFGILTCRCDVQDGNGSSGPIRPSASTLAQNATSCGASAKLMMTSAGGGNAGGMTSEHDEIEVFFLLILDQHTFEGCSTTPRNTTHLCQAPLGTHGTHTIINSKNYRYYIFNSVHLLLPLPGANDL